MKPLLDPDVERYLHELPPASEPVLLEMEGVAAERDFPIVGPLVGRLLFVLARSIRAESVFELGSGFGYSALWFAKAMAGAGRVVLTEGKPENVAAARGYFERSGLADRAAFETGNALETIARYPGPFDVVFLDLDKQDYPRALDLALPRLRKGGLLIADNTLWSGRVARPAEDDATRGIQEFNRCVMGSPDLVGTIVPLRDGVLVAVRL